MARHPRLSFRLGASPAVSAFTRVFDALEPCSAGHEMRTALNGARSPGHPSGTGQRVVPAFQTLAPGTWNGRGAAPTVQSGPLLLEGADAAPWRGAVAPASLECAFAW